LCLEGVVNKRKLGRGTMKGFTATAKRFKHGSVKLSVDFSSTHGGPVGFNYRTFIDEIVLFTRKRTPLIGVRKWGDVKQIVKDKIARDIMVCTSFVASYHKIISVTSKFFTVSWSSHLYRLGGILRTMMKRRLGYGRLQRSGTKDGELN
jgi:hypothetical protein